MRNLALVASLGLILVGCGDDKGGGGSVRGNLGQCYGTEGQTCTGTAEYETCIKTNCGTEMAAAFGADWQSGTVAGACKAMSDCEKACPCDATNKTCSDACMTAALKDTACMTALTAMGTCMTGKGATCTEPKCTSTTTPPTTDKQVTCTGGTKVTLGGACLAYFDEIAKCCPKLYSSEAIYQAFAQATVCNSQYTAEQLNSACDAAKGQVSMVCSQLSSNPACK